MTNLTPSEILRNRSERAKAKQKVVKRKKKVRREKVEENYLEKIKSRDFSSMNARDMVTFYRSYYQFHETNVPIRESQGMALKIFANLIETYGAAKAMDIVVASFESSRVPRSVRYFASSAVNEILVAKVFENLKRDAKESVIDWLKTLS